MLLDKRVLSTEEIVMANPIVYDSSANGTTQPVLSALGGQDVEVTTTQGQSPPTVTLDATLLVGSLTVTADSGATAIVDVIASVAGTLALDANGGIIEASSAIGALSGTSVTIENNGTFVAESSFLSLLNSTSITFAGNSKLVLDNGGGLLNLSETAPIAGFQSDGDHVIDDKLIQGTSVAQYSITQTGQAGADVLTFLSSTNASLGSLTFAAGTFNPGELGTYLVGDLSGPLQMSVGSDGGITTDTAAVLDGGGDSGGFEAGGRVTLHSGAASWDTVTGSGGSVYVTDASGSIVGGTDTIYFDRSSNDAVSLYNTNGAWDLVKGSNGEVILNSAQSSVVGGGDSVYLLGNGAQASLYNTNGAWDLVSGSHGTTILNSAQASVVGGNDVVYLNGTGDQVSLYSTNGNWDLVSGSNATIIVNSAQTSIVGGGDIVNLQGTGTQISLYNTNGAWDLINGSNAAIIVNSSQTSIVGGDDVVYLSGTGAQASVYSTNEQWDLISGSNAAVNLTDSQATLVGANDQVYLHGTDSLGFQAAFGTDTIVGYTSADTLVFTASDQGKLAFTQSGNNNTQITLDGSDVLTLTNVNVANLGTIQYK
jgi:hypothetical protein